MGEEQPHKHKGQSKKLERRWSRDSSAALGGDHGEAAVLLEAMEVHGDRDPPTAHGGGADAGASGCLKEVVSP